MEIAKTYIKFEADISDLKARLAKAERALKEVGTAAAKSGSIFTRNLTPSFKSAGSSATVASSGIERMAKRLIALGSAYLGVRGISSLSRSFLEVATSTEQYQLRLEVLLGSQEAAADAMEFFRQTAAKVPFTLQEVIESGTTLTAMGADLKAWTPILTDLSAVMGMKLPEAASALGRAFAGGAGAADIFRERGILQIIKDSARMKHGIEDITKVTLPKFRELMLEAFTDPGGKIAGAADKLATTWQGTISMLQDKWFQFREAVMKSGVFEILKKGLAELNAKLDEFVESGKMEEWANKTAQGVLQAFRVIVQGVQGLLVGIQIVRAAWYDLNIAINQSALRIYQKVLPSFALLSKVLPEAKTETIKLVKEMANLMVETTEYAKANDEATDKAADLINAFDGLISILNEAIGSTEKAGKKIKEVTDTAIKPQARAIQKELVPNWWKYITAVGKGYPDAVDAAADATGKFGDGVKEKTFDLEKFWDDFNEHIQAAWIRGLSRMLTEFKDFSGAVKSLFDNIRQICADIIAAIVVEWAKGLLKIKGATKLTTEAIGLAFQAAAVFFATTVVQGLLTKLGVLKGQVDAEVQAILDKLDEAKKKGEDILNSIKKSQLALGIPGTGELPFGGYRGPTWSDKWNEAVEAGTDAIRNLIVEMRNAGVQIAEATRYILEQLDKIPAALTTLTANATKNIDKLGKLTIIAFKAMIAEGRSWTETLEAMKEPLMALKARYEELGRDIPGFLKPIFAMLDKMEEMPKVFERLDAARTILDSLKNAVYLTQNAFDALIPYVGRFAREILGIDTNLNQALKTMKLTDAQIQQLLPVISQFVGAAAIFGLHIPGWMRTFVTQQLGVDWTEFKQKVAAQANAGLETVKKLQRLIDKQSDLKAGIQDAVREGRRAIVEKLGDVIGAIQNIGGYQHGGVAFRPQLARVAEREPEAIIPLRNLDRLAKAQPSQEAANNNLNNFFSKLEALLTAQPTGERLVERPINIHVHSNLDGKEIAFALAKHVPQFTRNQIWRISDRALTEV